MRIDLRPPAWATHLLSDAGDWQHAPVPVAEMRPIDLPDDTYFEYAYLDSEGERRPDPDNPRPTLCPARSRPPSNTMARIPTLNRTPITKRLILSIMR